MIPLNSRIEKHASARDAHNARARGNALGDLVELIERMSAEKRSTRQIAEAARAFLDGLETPPAEPAGALVWISAESPQGRAWAAWWREHRSRHGYPVDRRGGWLFPSPWPPGAS